MIEAELLEKLRNLDEVTILELLDLKTDDIIDAFLDRIVDRLAYIYKELEE